MSALRIATRGSDLALAQSNAVAARIRSTLGVETELVVIRTSGDRIQTVSLAKLGGKGLFVKELEEALLADRADLAVHSAKDLPAAIARGLRLAAFPERVDPRDALVVREPDPGADRRPTLDRLRERARVGTGSTRRTAQLRALRPDLEIVPLRGNVPTRIAKLGADGLDAVMLACAGLDRLGLDGFVCERIAPERMLPAIGQGTLALETRDDVGLASELAVLDDPEAAISLAAERGFLARLQGDCTVPLAAHATRDSDGRLRLRGLLASADGSRILRHEDAEIVVGDGVRQRALANALGERAAQQILDAGGGEILAELRRAGAAVATAGEA